MPVCAHVRACVCVSVCVLGTSGSRLQMEDDLPVIAELGIVPGAQYTLLSLDSLHDPCVFLEFFRVS